MKLGIFLISIVMAFTLNVKEQPSFADMSVEQRAEQAGMSTEDFIFISSVVEAESNRQDNEEAMLGRVYISLVILNRVNDDRFPDTISGVLNQSGQFSTVRNSRSVTDRTDLSDEAVIEAVRIIEAGEAPPIFFFNCIGYNYGEPFAYVAGNYFMTWEA